MLGAALKDFSVKGRLRTRAINQMRKQCCRPWHLHPARTVTGTYNGTPNYTLTQTSYVACIPFHDSQEAYRYSSKILQQFPHQQT